MKVICIGNYPPRKCGIATFTENLVKSMMMAAEINHDDLEIEIITMNDQNQVYDYSEKVVRVINDQVLDEYISAADFINQSGAEVCLLEHEYGIFGGDSGLLLLRLLRRVNIPIVTTLHTVLQSPTFLQKEVLKTIAKYSSKLVVMSNLAVRFLKEVFEIPENKILRIEHGVPDYKNYANKEIIKPKEFLNRKVILTFGLIGRSKGIEVALRALPKVVEKHPDLLYVILGKTHPHVVKHAGEEYREFLAQLTKDLKIENNVLFENRYVDEEELINYLLASDIYITPYHNKAQITSGTLAYAVGGGSAIISTPYWHAEELLANDTGILFDFGDKKHLSNIINDLLDHPDKLKAYQKKAYQYGLKIAWPIIGNQYNECLKEAIDQFEDQKESFKIPPLKRLHLERMTDKTGIIQFAKGSLPDYRTGYCLDDNARALLLCLRAYKRFKDDNFLQLIYRYSTYLIYMRNENGSYKNYLSYNKEFIDQIGSDDAFGRTIWALGYLIRYAPNDSILQIGHEMFVRSLGWFNELKHARGWANTMLGLYHYIKKYPDREEFGIRLNELAKKMAAAFYKFSKDDWYWYEDILTYDNGLLPAAMYRAHEVLHNDEYLEIAEKSAQFLERKCFTEGYLRIIGNREWYPKFGEFAIYGQQPIDAAAMVILYHAKYQALQCEDAATKLKICFEWFLGKNDHSIPMYDEETGGCNDGLEEFTINRNQGAESTISYIHAYLIAGDYY
ncbi:MAG: glycosyltransferase [Bacteroidetes bacterium]|nr:glycosyltransferase [Bacteroidota bacterium]